MTFLSAWLVRRYGAAAAERIGKLLWLGLALAVCLVFWVGYAVFWYRHGFSIAENRAKVQMTALRLDQERALTAQRQQALVELREAVELAETLREKVDALASERQAAVRTIIKRIPDVTTVYVPAPGAEPVAVPACPFTVGYRRLWNDALEADAGSLRADSTAGAAELDAEGRAAADPAGANPAEPADAALAIAAGVTPAALLENHTLNAARCAGIETDRAALIQWIHARRGPEVPQP